MPNRWSSDNLAAITSTPWSQRERADPEVRFQEAAPREEPVAVAPPQPARRFRIADADLRKHGYTDGCVQCNFIQRYGKTKPGTQHSETCRNRIIDEISKTPDGEARLSAHSARVDRFLAEHLEAHDLSRATRAVPGGDAPGIPPTVSPQRRNGFCPTITRAPPTRASRTGCCSPTTRFTDKSLLGVETSQTRTSPRTMRTLKMRWTSTTTIQPALLEASSPQSET